MSRFILARAFFAFALLCALSGCGSGETTLRGTWRVSPSWAAKEGARQNPDKPGAGAIMGASGMSSVTLEFGNDGVFAMSSLGAIFSGSWQSSGSNDATIVVTALNGKPINEAMQPNRGSSAPDPNAPAAPPSVSTGPVAPGETPPPAPAPVATPTVLRMTAQLDPQDPNRLTLVTGATGSGAVTEIVFQREG